LIRIINISVSIYANAIGGIFIELMSLDALIRYGYAKVIPKPIKIVYDLIMRWLDRSIIKDSEE
jgi:H+/Cl- antiporter ClcA